MAQRRRPTPADLKFWKSRLEVLEIQAHNIRTGRSHRERDRWPSILDAEKMTRLIVEDLQRQLS